MFRKKSFKQFFTGSDYIEYTDLLNCFQPRNQQQFEADFSRFVDSSLRKPNGSIRNKVLGFSEFECFKSVESDTYWKKVEIDANLGNIDATQQLAYVQNLQCVSNALLKRKENTAAATTSDKPVKRTRTQVVKSNHVSSQCISDDSSNPNSSLPSSYFPSDLEGPSIGYTFEAWETVEIKELPIDPAPWFLALLTLLYSLCLGC
ncbi:hypothetical protein MUCCIDRAFT_112104 [Mucor lusitanicus CBS 277.49]|uniref:Uncharacterized protein n=2 Tax=Mucor circinelloides f. lusitanicus TaxID=29924 RepID=A0A168J3C7_MUCCL|nr:hypothetical protein MUCCIDRAFT_112104 [Mucor lusitanicus CBS 277.49]